MGTEEERQRCENRKEVKPSWPGQLQWPAFHVNSGWREYPGYSIDANLGVAEEVFCRLG